MNDHPKAIEARTQAENARARRETEIKHIREAVAVHGLHFVYCGTYTLCYSVARRDIVRLSTAIKHPNDAESRHIAQLTAVENYLNGQSVLLRRPKYPTHLSKQPFQRPPIKRWLAGMFYDPTPE